MRVAEQAALDQILAGLRELAIMSFRLAIELHEAMGSLTNYVEACANEAIQAD